MAATTMSASALPASLNAPVSVPPSGSQARSQKRATRKSKHELELENTLAEKDGMFRLLYSVLSSQHFTEMLRQLRKEVEAAKAEAAAATAAASAATSSQASVNGNVIPRPHTKKGSSQCGLRMGDIPKMLESLASVSNGKSFYRSIQVRPSVSIH